MEEIGLYTCRSPRGFREFILIIYVISLPNLITLLKGFNLSEGKWGYNDIKRNGGRFLWKQIFNAKRQGVRSMYGAMWDEYVSLYLDVFIIPCQLVRTDMMKALH